MHSTERHVNSRKAQVTLLTHPEKASSVGLLEVTSRVLLQVSYSNVGIFHGPALPLCSCSTPCHHRGKGLLTVLYMVAVLLLSHRLAVSHCWSGLHILQGWAQPGPSVLYTALTLLE